jgi:hypothetical protein
METPKAKATCSVIRGQPRESGMHNEEMDEKDDEIVHLSIAARMANGRWI